MDSLSGISKVTQRNIDTRKPVSNSTIRTVDPNMSDRESGLLPFYLGWKGGETIDAIQCMAAGDNGYHANQAAYNHGLNNAWATKNTPWSWGYYKREDIPAQFAIAEGWTSADMYQV